MSATPAPATQTSGTGQPAKMQITKKDLLSYVIWISAALILYLCIIKPYMNKPDEVAVPASVQFPISGSGTATMTNPQRMWLNPFKTYTRSVSCNVKYVLESDPSVSIVINNKPEKTTLERKRELALMPVGNYLVYPVGCSEIVFSWWQ